MKKKLLLFLLTVCSLPIFGKQITVNEATQIARVHQSQNSSVLFRSADIQLVKTVQGNSKSKKTQKAPNLYYVFDKGNNHGYIIIAADDVCTPVIGYTTEGTYNEEDLPPNYIEWMEKVQQGIEEAILKEKKTTEKVKKQWQSYLNFATAAFRLEKSVSPLIKTAWSQAHPFWNSIPVKNQSGKPALTGCVATAMAQIMKYHKFPSKGILATSSYTTRTLEIKIPSIDITQYTYDWDNMLTGYNPGLSNAAQEKAVADLMYHCGAALHMDYNYGGSNAYANDVAWVLKTYFGYNPKIQYLNRRTKTDDEWISILKSNLDNNLPISYAGSSSNSGHVFICDGYDAQGLFHFNWGWNGYRNGYYSIDATLGFTMDQNIVHNIKPLFVSTYNKVDKEGLRKVLRQGRNLSGLGLTASDTLSWEKSEEWVAKVKGVTWKDSEQGKRISRIYWWSQFPKLTGTIDITPFPEIEEVIFPFNAVTAFIASDNSKLKKIDAGYNNMTEVTVNNCTAVNTLLVHFNRLEKINVTNWNSVTTLYVYNNKFRFSTLPLKSIAKYSYGAQARIEGGTISAGKTIDLSSEYSVDNTLTQYKWYNGNTEISLASNGNGKFIADPKYVNTTLTCKMTNSKFPRFTLEYTVKIEKSQGIYNESDKEGLRNILNQGSNYASVGLSDDDLKNWNISEEWVSKVRGVTWKDSEQGKRISRIYWWNHPIKITGTIDITPFPEIEEAIFPFNSVTAFRASDNSKLKTIDAGYNNMTEVTVNNCTAVNTLLVHFNRLEKINVTNWNSVTTLYVYNNKFRFSTLPLKSIAKYSYDAQARIEDGTISAGKTIDLSSEYSVDNTLTQYKWYNGSTEISLASNGNGKFIADPKYVNTTLTCKMTNLKFPRFTLEYTIYINNPTTLYSSDIVSSDISIYPNPVIDILHFDTFNEIQSIEIYNFDGKLIKQEKNIKNNRIDVRLLSSGIYLLTIKTNTQQLTLRFIKK
ncbi:thiol protease/hemagglutinin PrtT [Apibacter sp. HY039]|uniref:thiol protease/hemagglutinin PrtT n=1 Tax=Apibacter sp. HY039 TaxID=2501476 RepID=UPI000FEB8933|nr:thiol protease/hemagglutinin PrtT [Apibacter sp. HY039]